MVPIDDYTGGLSREPSAKFASDPEAIAELQYLYFRYRFVSSDPMDFVQWAIGRLELGQDGDDLDIVLLASLEKADSPRKLIERIFQKYTGVPVEDEQLLAGKYVVLLYERYLAESESVKSLTHQLDELDWWLGYGSWVSALSYTCALAAGWDSGYQEPFEQEFDYLAGLWSAADSYDEFQSRYDSNISRQHDGRPQKSRGPARSVPHAVVHVKPPKATKLDSGELAPADEGPSSPRGSILDKIRAFFHMSPR